MGTAVKHPVLDWIKPSRITSDDLTRSGTGCFIAVPMWQQWASKG